MLAPSSGLLRTGLALKLRGGKVAMAQRRHAGRRPAMDRWLVPPLLVLSNFGNYDATYGSLGAAIGLMMWMWMSAITVLFGAELNSKIEHQTARDTTIGRPKPLSARDAAMADTLGPSIPAASKEH
jgi:hypothetical protein